MDSQVNASEELYRNHHLEAFKKFIIQVYLSLIKKLLWGVGMVALCSLLQDLRFQITN